MSTLLQTFCRLIQSNFQSLLTSRCLLYPWLIVTTTCLPLKLWTFLVHESNHAAVYDRAIELLDTCDSSNEIFYGTHQFIIVTSIRVLLICAGILHHLVCCCCWCWCIWFLLFLIDWGGTNEQQIFSKHKERKTAQNTCGLCPAGTALHYPLQ